MICGLRLRGAPLFVVFTVFALTTGACLPRGDAPAGRQILADKTAMLTALVPANGDGLVRALFFRPGKDADNVNLWVVAADPNGGPSTEMMLFADIDTGLQLGYRPSATNPGFPLDSQGRASLTRFVPGAGPDQPYTIQVLAADPVTGEVVELDQTPNIARVPRTWEYPTVSNYMGLPVVFAANGGVTVTDVASYGFGGSTAFYLTTEGTLVSLDPAGTARQLATGISTFLVISAQEVLITRAVADPDMNEPPPSTNLLGPPGPPAQVTGAFLDTATLLETPLPDGLLYQNANRVSPSGRWLIVSQMSQDPENRSSGGAVLLDTVTATIEPLDPVFSFNAGWRPGHDELWATWVSDPEQSASLSTASLSIKRPGLPVVTVPGVFFTHFSEDGNYWFSRGAPLSAPASSELVGVADDPTAPRFAAGPAGSSLTYDWSLGDGRVLTDSLISPDSFQSSFDEIVDPRNGATQLVGERGYLSAVGTTRALGIYGVSYLRGDLTSTDFATGRRTVLAPEFAMAALPEPRGADPYPPGGRIVYQFVARFDSPWDGLWMATVP